MNDVAEPVRLYLDLMKRSLSNTIYQDPRVWFGDWSGTIEVDRREVRPFDEGSRTEGLDIPSAAHTMIGRQRLDNLQECTERVIADGVPGDLLEAGVWRGGATILMRAVLEAHGVRDRTVWVADSFEGLPEADPERYPADRGGSVHLWNDLLGVSREQVEENFRRYGLLDDRVRFLQGWFRDTLPTAPVESLAVLRVDGDLYESTMDALTHLYPRLSVGGFVIIDDYGALAPCRLAVQHFRKRHGITEPITRIDRSGVFWRRTEPEAAR
ncbi:O-methyltransferase/demethyldecarbamoylnovobiocinO-methyltransferase/8-demethyl-8-(2,3-dimethoxy-alpha-L-rhamnosyl)tetracenomycin-C 4'-O-methyltransferase [Nocardiopsis flavescens]|uniref:O-methyltransferase/demethyldecarbamoylnovobiocin O-methyltransferase/8-demethyl-8-(2,3-dimethoxy-alpha-L-rhamnosyl)tetracenomycin-C 4'-O-methyltransferase n=1 Tax=Nocardiopsis flavescens TaxID=758803 RepID=A0A1M6LQI2_9ACTN|nr:TylF/MycF family methyltransferase [Nocardiopsis flavescens]SHJ73468.1 O-methyltransferase/demethyldecarbamoylnovobiocinO-methyltransferase/8-demethyl-8-(2,3-dimethoxy-alpha-L-rhamnosyl)tetracenomycin-C 4'-O-methyltransferase [Nocardiopsis flavescens]